MADPKVRQRCRSEISFLSKLQMTADGEERARLLVQAVHLSAIASFPPSADRFPSVASLDSDLWDSVLRTAYLYVAITALKRAKYDRAHRDKLIKMILDEAQTADSDALAALDDCHTFFRNSYKALSIDPDLDKGFFFADTLGVYIVWNLLGHPVESNEEQRMARQLGVHCMDIFGSWWMDQSDQAEDVTS